MTTLLSPAEIASALHMRDLSDPADGPHAMHMLLAGAIDAGWSIAATSSIACTSAPRTRSISGASCTANGCR